MKTRGNGQMLVRALAADAIEILEQQRAGAVVRAESTGDRCPSTSFRTGPTGVRAPRPSSSGSVAAGGQPEPDAPANITEQEIGSVISSTHRAAAVRLEFSILSLNP